MGTQFVELTCRGCGGSFPVPAWRVRGRVKEGREVKYCSPTCFHARGHSQETRRKISDGLRRYYERKQR